MNAEEKIIKHLTPKQFIITLAVSIFMAGGAVYGAFYRFLESNRKNVEQTVNRAVIPLQVNDSIMLELIRGNIVQTKAEEFKSREIVKYINDPALTKTIEAQTEIIRAFTEELKKNENIPMKSIGSTQ